MAWQQWGRRAALCASLIGGGGAAHAQVPTGPDVVLVHAFSIPDGDSWGAVAIGLAAGGWRVGAANGPPASEAQLRSALRSLVAFEVGGRCTGWVSGPTAYPCGFSVRAVDLAGTVPELYAAVAVDQQSVLALRERVDLSVPPARHASVPSSPTVDDEHFVALRLPPAYLGDKSETYGGTLQFEIRALSNPLVPSKFNRAGGQVILRANLPGERS